MKWTDIHSDEIYFRDTAHGLLSWAVASLVTAALLGSIVSGLFNTSAQALGGVGAATVTMSQKAALNTPQDDNRGTLSYFADALLRADQPVAGTDQPVVGNDRAADNPKREVATILAHGMSTGTLQAQDKTYLAKLVSERTGVSQSDAEKRVDDLYAQAQQTVEDAKVKAKETADVARKAAAGAALWAFVALLCGAFFASLAAIWGGRRRDAAVLEPVHHESL